MDKTLFLENKISEDISSEGVFIDSEIMSKSAERKKSDKGFQKTEENFDFTSDIIDLLLCVENDENARQNIESIMDQWDEMNILEDDRLKSSITAETSTQIKIKNVEHSQEIKLQLEKSQKTEKILFEESEQLIVSSNLVVQDAIETMKNCESYNRIPEEPEIIKHSNDKKFLATDSHNQISDRLNSVTATSQKSLSENNSIITKLEIDALTTIISESTRNQPSKNCQSFNTFSFSQNQFQINEKFLKKEQIVKSDDDNLSERIKNLVCAVCHKNHEQLMSSGEIKKMQCKPYPCPFCRGNYYQKSSANIHMKVHMEEESLKCRLCVDANEEILRKALKHDADHEVESICPTKKRLKLDSFICSTCSLSLNSQMELVRHMAAHKSNLKFSRRCVKKQLSDCKYHKKTNDEVDGLQKSKNCRKCTKTVVTTVQRQNKYECKICGKRFINQLNFECHYSSHNRKNIKKVYNIAEKSANCSTLDHSYGKSMIAASYDRTRHSTDENENIKTSKSKIVNSDTQLKNRENRNVAISVMEADESIRVFESNGKRNYGSANEFNSTAMDDRVAQYDYNLSECVQSEASSKTQTVYVVQNRVFNEDASHIVCSSLPESPLLNSFFSQYVKPDMKINAVISKEDELSNVNEANGDLQSSLMAEKISDKSFPDSRVVFQQNFHSESGTLPKNSKVSYDGSNLLSNLINFNNSDMLNCGLVSNDIDELRTEELMSNDIDNIFQQYFYAQNDEKILNSDFIENIDQTKFLAPNQILPVATYTTENNKLEKTAIYNSTADTLSQFINTNISDDTELESNEIIAELFSNSDATECTPSNGQYSGSNGIPGSVDAQKNVFATTKANTVEHVNSALISKNHNNMVKIQNANSVINLMNNSICLNNVLANISSLALVPPVKGEETDRFLTNENQSNNLESNTASGKMSTILPKSYLVVYVLPSSNNLKTSTPTITGSSEQKTVASSTSTKETFKLPTVEGKTTYLVPIITNKVDNANRVNELSVRKDRTSYVNSSVKKCVRVPKSRSVHKNFDVLKNSFKGRQNKSQLGDHDGKKDVKNEICITYTNSKCSNTVIGLPNNKSKKGQVLGSDEILKYDSKSPILIRSARGENILSTLESHCSVSTTQKNFSQADLNGKCNKRNILQIAYDDACKLIEDSVNKTVHNEVHPAKDSPMISKNCSGTQVTTKSVTSSSSATTANTTLTGNYTILKQMLNSKSCVSASTAKQIDYNKNFQVPVEISFTSGQVTFQYSQNNIKEEGKQDDASLAQHMFQNTETLVNAQTIPLVVKSDTQEKCTCEICHNNFPKSEFLPHMKTHNKTLYKCTYCQGIFVQQLSLIQHMRAHLQPQIFNCKMCKKSFTNILLFRLHLLVHKGLLFICVSCIKLFNKKEEYENHLKMHNKNYLICSQCKRNFPNNVNGSSVIQHFTCMECISSGQKLDQTELKNENSFLKDSQPNASTNVSIQHELKIGKSFVKREPSIESATYHVNGFEEDLCFLCEYCDRICNGGVEFKNHKEFHVKNTIKCVICGDHFGKFSTLKHHLKTHDIKRILKCDFCSDTFHDKRLYQNHTHKNFKPYPCAVCEESFYNKTDFTTHSASHIADPEFVCNYCGLKFLSTTPQTILTHKQSHLTESIAECDKCDKTFLFQSELKNHSLEIHNEQLPCPFCDQIFENNDSYVNHRKTHDLCKCDKCNFVFADRTLLSKHIQIHVENIFSCKHCDVEFGEFNELLSHTINLHPGKDLKCFKCSCCSRFFTNELQWMEHGKQVEKKTVLLPYLLKQFTDRSFKLEPDTKNIYSCHQCNENFRNKNEIIKHIKSH